MRDYAVELLPYQRDILLDKSRFIIAMQARQTRKTWTGTLKVVNNVLDEMAAGRRSDWIVFSRGERQSKEAMDEGIKRHLAAYKLATKYFEYPITSTDKVLEVALPNGAKIGAVPCNPDTVRGFSRNVLADEFGLYQNSREIWAALFPVITNGYKMIITSTPRGKGNKFYELWTEKTGIWSKHRMDIYDAVKQGLPLDPEELKSALMDDDAWRQEYLLEFLDEAHNWLPYDLINSCEHQDAGDPNKYQNNAVFLGIDIARRNDLFVIYALEMVGDVLWTREIVTRKNCTFAEQDHLLNEMMNKYRVARVFIDQTGMGEKPVEDAKRRYGDYKVQGMLFTAANKLLLATDGKRAMEDHKVRLPAGDEVLRADLHKIKKDNTGTGVPKFTAESDSSGHADIAWAFFLAVQAAQSKNILFEFQAVPQRRANDHEYTGKIYTGFSRRGDY